MKKKFYTHAELVQQVTGLVKSATSQSFQPDQKILYGPKISDVSFLKIRTRICKKYGVVILEEAFRTAETINQLVDVLEKKLNEEKTKMPPRCGKFGF